MKINFKNLTMTVALFGSMSVYATIPNDKVAVLGEGHVYTPKSLPQNDIDKEAAGAFDNHKTTRDMHAAPAKKVTATGNNSTVMSVQKALNELDYNSGKVDGIMGANTMAALEKFQRENDITPTGRLNAETLEALEIDNKAMYNDDFEIDAFAE